MSPIQYANDATRLQHDGSEARPTELLASDALTYHQLRLNAHKQRAQTLPASDADDEKL